VAEWIGPAASEVTQIVPELRQLLPGLPEPPSAALVEPEQARFRLLDSTVSFLRRAAETQPLLIVLDDLHAADTTSLMMLLALAREIRGTRVAVAGTYRETEIRHSPERAELIAAAERDGVRVPLRGLGEAEIREFVELAAGVQPPSNLVALLGQKTEGNPFFLSEILRQMAAEGQLGRHISGPPRQLRIPDGVRESINRHLAPLSEDARGVLTIAAVIGREFDLACLAHASEAPREKIASLLDNAFELELVTAADGPPGRYSFRHALIREALYDALPATRRLKLHALVGDAIRHTYPLEMQCTALAYHYCEAAPLASGDDAVHYSRLAARLAGDQLAYEEASRHLRRALEILPLATNRGEVLRAELLLELGKAQARAGDLAEARKTCLEAADIARRENEIELFARAVVAAGRTMSDSGTTDHSLVAMLRDALERLGEDDSAVRAQVLARLGVELYWCDREEGTGLCERAVAIAGRLTDPHTSIIALWARHLALRNPDSLEQRLEDTREVIRIAELAGERDFALEARYYRIADLLEIDDIAGADREHQEYLKAEAELRDRFKRGLLLEGMRAQLDGRFADAENLAQQAFAAGQQSGRPLTFNGFLLQTGHVMWERGRLGEVEATLHAYIAENPLIVYCQCAMLQCLLQSERKAEAIALFERLAADEFGAIPRDWNWIPAMFIMAVTCADLGMLEHAPILYKLLAPYAARNAVLGFVYCYGSVHYALGRLATAMGNLEDAELHYRAALIANQRLRASCWIAHTRFELAALLGRRNRADDRVRAAELLASARRTAQALGAVRLQRAIEELVSDPACGLGQSFAPSGANGYAGGRSDEDRTANDRLLNTLTALPGGPLYPIGSTQLDGVITFLFSDMVDSSAMFDQRGDLHAQSIVRLHNEIVREHVARHRGVEVKTTGDGFMIAFASARRALLCAIAIQRALAAYCEQHASEPIRVRMGLHVGESVRESNDFHGKAVILASRIMEMARAGEILLSATLRDLTASAGDLRFAEEREVELKGFTGTYQICCALWDS
jgi:class 3 adenylate cyclase